MTWLTNVVFFFVDYLPENGRKRPKHVGGLLLLIVRSGLLLSIVRSVGVYLSYVVQFLVRVLKHGLWLIPIRMIQHCRSLWQSTFDSQFSLDNVGQWIVTVGFNSLELALDMHRLHVEWFAISLDIFCSYSHLCSDPSKYASYSGRY